MPSRDEKKGVCLKLETTIKTHNNPFFYVIFDGERAFQLDIDPITSLNSVTHVFFIIIIFIRLISAKH